MTNLDSIRSDHQAVDFGSLPNGEPLFVCRCGMDTTRHFAAKVRAALAAFDALGGEK